MNSSTFWFLCLFGAVLLYQGGCRPNEQLDTFDEYPQDGDPEDYDGEGDIEDEDEGPDPEIISKPHTVEMKPGGVAFLPCDVKGNSDSFSRIWRKDSVGLFVGSVRQIQDFRINQLSNGSLEIRQVNVNDSGDYRCMLSKPAGTKREVTHTLHVLTPAVITHVMPAEKMVSVKKSASLTLECQAQGHPTPSIKWFRNGHLLHNSDPSIHGARYTIESASTEDSGVYKCTASNGQQLPDERVFNLLVIFPPEIKVVKEVVATGEGYESELKCSVSGIKRPELKWYKDNEQKPLKASDRIKFEHNGHEHILKIIKTQESDFGVYKCEAKNSEGESSADIELTGRPTKPEADTVMTEGESKSPVVMYRLESFSPIVEYELLYKKQESNEWISVKPTVGPTAPSNDKLYIMRHVLTGLEPGVYDAQLKAKNTFGWSELSNIQTFPQEHAGDLTETGLLAVSSTASNELRISLALFASLLVARYYC